MQVDADARCIVKTPGGSVTADHVVVATHYPFLDRSLAFARVTQQRSYALLCRIAGEPPAGMFISGDSPTRSVRAVPLAGEELLLVGGEGHKTGQGGDTEERYGALERFAREHWDVQSVEYRWSAQDDTTIDGVPYVGPLTPGDDAGADGDRLRQVGHDRRDGRRDDPVRPAAGPRAPVGRAVRPQPRQRARSAVKFLEENAKVGLHFVGDRLTKRGTRPIEELAPGEGDIVATRARRSRATAATTARSSPSPRLHPPRLPGQLEHGGAQLGLSLPRLALHPGGRGAPGPGRASPRDQARPLGSSA